MPMKIIKTGNNYNSSKHRQIMIDSQSELQDIDVKDIGVGSIAYTCAQGGLAKEYMWLWSGTKWIPMASGVKNNIISGGSGSGSAGGNGQVAVQCLLAFSVNEDMQLLADLIFT